MTSYFTFADASGTPHAVFSGRLDVTECGRDITMLPHPGDDHWDESDPPKELCPTCRAALV